jgi:hypothetical protein
VTCPPTSGANTPYTATVSDGVLTMDLVGAYGKLMLSGFTITKV